MTDLIHSSLLPFITQWLEEDDLTRNFHYSKTLPQVPVCLSLKLKSDLILAGTDYFVSTFKALGAREVDWAFLTSKEGSFFKAGEVVEFPFEMPFNVAVSGERLALNLLAHASSISTWTAKHVEKAAIKNIKILDTRKTTPGLRSLEKYAVRVGGGYNHRFGQADVWMIKDNHKTCLGGLKGAWEFFKSQQTFYSPVVVEIHDLAELAEAIGLGVKHVMLDNFSPDLVREAVKMKSAGMTFEISGGLRFEFLDKYLIDGVDALSIGALTNAAPRVDISLKFRPV